MRIDDLHSWDFDYREAIALQKRLAKEVIVETRLPDDIKTVAGVDVSYRKHGDQFFAAVVLLDLPDLTPIETAAATARVSFPYIPGLLSFRELPVLIEAFRKLQTIPDLVIVDGQGIAHPRRFGLASHLGLWLGLPTIGCAKSRLVGDYVEPGEQKGDVSRLDERGEQIGIVLRSRTRVRPLFVSPGHLVAMSSAADLVLKCTGRYRMPEPTRLAHHETNRLRRAWEATRAG